MRPRHGRFPKEPQLVACALGDVGEGQRRKRLALSVFVEHNIDGGAMSDGNFNPLGAIVEPDENLFLLVPRPRGGAGQKQQEKRRDQEQRTPLRAMNAASLRARIFDLLPAATKHGIVSTFPVLPPRPLSLLYLSPARSLSHLSDFRDST